MDKVEDRESEVVDLGPASVETKGSAILDTDVGGGHLRFHPGIAEE